MPIMTALALLKSLRNIQKGIAPETTPRPKSDSVDAVDGLTSHGLSTISATINAADPATNCIRSASRAGSDGLNLLP